jgi:hypothetical protein
MTQILKIPCKCHSSLNTPINLLGSTYLVEVEDFMAYLLIEDAIIDVAWCLVEFGHGISFIHIFGHLHISQCNSHLSR